MNVSWIDWSKTGASAYREFWKSRRCQSSYLQQDWHKARCSHRHVWIMLTFWIGSLRVYVVLFSAFWPVCGQQATASALMDHSSVRLSSNLALLPQTDGFIFGSAGGSGKFTFKPTLCAYFAQNYTQGQVIDSHVVAKSDFEKDLAQMGGKSFTYKITEIPKKLNYKITEDWACKTQWIVYCHPWLWACNCIM